ncbi:inositol-3-phosphate synthase [Brevipalpus obovatus]|uniref:inositol-3-phosphate synthase n=1 Tax=Brevipalpus obovatus TaxID=246614 RepID=UPI003D9DC23F
MSDDQCTTEVTSQVHRVNGNDNCIQSNGRRKYSSSAQDRSDERTNINRQLLSPSSASSSAVSSLPSLGSGSGSSMVSEYHGKLPVISARARNFLVGSIGHQESALGDDELSRIFPNGLVNVMVITWNMSGKKGPDEINDILLPDNIEFVPDIYAIGTQESPGNSGSNEMRELIITLQSTIGPHHVLLHSAFLGVLHVCLFVRRDLIWYVSLPEDDYFNLRTKATNIVKTKGAVCISFALFGTTFLFVNCHLSAHSHRNQERMDDYDRICRSINLPRNLRPLKPKYNSTNATSRFDVVFWFGDLNFRIEQDYSNAIRMLTRASLTSFEALLHDDQLSKALDKGDIFYGFREAAIRFAPTYKYRIGTDGFDILRQRVPSYTDRILYRCKRSDQVSCIVYDCAQRVKTSDHKPVYALMEVKIKPGRDDIPLNAGAFRRDIYLDGLKRRSRDMPNNSIKNHSSVICVLS